MGGGCCDIGLECTVLSGTNYCTATAGSASVVRTGSNRIMATGASKSTSASHALSTGAKAGIGVGVSVVALAGIGACIFFFTIHRRREPQSSSSSHPEGSDNYQDTPPAMSQTSGGASKAGSQGSQGS